MSQTTEYVGNKIRDLISESNEEFTNYDSSVWTRTVKQEIINPIEGDVSGEIPKWLNGSLLQNGPGAYKIGDVMLNDVFDGMGLLHRFNIANGRVTYQNKFVPSESNAAIKKENRVIYGEFGTPPDPEGNIFQRFLSIFLPKPDLTTDNTSVTIYPIGKEFYAFTETPKIRKFDTKTLNSLEVINLKDYTGIVFQPAHPVVTEDGSLCNVGISITRSGVNYVVYFVSNAENKFENTKIIAKFSPIRKLYPSYMHSFGLTKNFFVVIEQPFTVSVLSLTMSLFMRIGFLETFKWFGNDPTYIHLVDRNAGQKVHTFEAEPFFFFHTINCFEENNQGPELVEGLLVENMRNLQAKLARTRMLTSRNLITLNGSDAKAYLQKNGTVVSFPELLCDYPMEFGTLNFKEHFAKNYQYFYGVGMDLYTKFPGQLFKVDTINKKVLKWQEENVYPSEGIFISSPNPLSEDDGVLVSALLRGKEETNCIELLFLDAKTFKELGRCAFKNLPSAVSKVFHGWYLDESN